MDSIFRLLYYSEQFPKNTAMNYTMLTLCHHLDQVPELAIDEIAELCNTNPMMLSRIVRKLGYKNFSEFRLAAQETITQSWYLNRNIPMGFVDEDNPAESFLAYMERTVSLLRSGETMAQIEAVCKALDQAKTVHFYGPPYFSIYMVMLLHDLISAGKEVHPYTSKESILLDMDSISEHSLVFVVPNDLVVDISLTRTIMETVGQRQGQLVIHTETGDPILGFSKGPNLTYPGDHTVATSMAGAFVLNMLTMTYRSKYLDRTMTDGKESENK